MRKIQDYVYEVTDEQQRKLILKIISLKAHPFVNFYLSSDELLNRTRCMYLLFSKYEFGPKIIEYFICNVYIDKYLIIVMDFVGYKLTENALQNKKLVSAIEHKIKKMHKLGIVHGDLHSNNIRFDGNGNVYFINVDTAFLTSEYLTESFPKLWLNRGFDIDNLDEFINIENNLFRTIIEDSYKPKKRLTSQPLNLYDLIRSDNYIHYNEIFRNITRLPFTINNVKNFAYKSKATSEWGAAREIGRSRQKFKKYLKFFPMKEEKRDLILVDVGCGDGLDLSYIRKEYNVKVINSVCADIRDERDFRYKRDSTHLTINLNTGLNIKDNTVDIIFLFHVIHHMMDDVYARLKDIYRILKIGGILCIKDHNVRDESQAKNVDFQHFVYELYTFKKSPFELAKKFPEYVPMSYYDSDEVDNMLKNIGFTQIFFNENKNLTYTYEAVYKKN